MENNSIKLIRVVKNLNVGMGVLVDFLNSKGYKIDKQPMARLTEEMYELLLAEFGDTDQRVLPFITIGRQNTNSLINTIELSVLKKITLPSRITNNSSDQEIIERLLQFWGVTKLEVVGKLTINEKGAFFNEVFINEIY